MTDSSSVQAPAPGGCCAAGEGFERALGLLSDAAFKVFAHLCLRAARAGGTLEFERSQLAQQVGKSRSALGRCLQELVRAGVCRIDPAPNQHRRSRLRLCAPFWPAAALAQVDGPARPAPSAADSQPVLLPSAAPGGARRDLSAVLLAAPARPLEALRATLGAS